MLLQVMMSLESIIGNFQVISRTQLGVLDRKQIIASFNKMVFS